MRISERESLWRQFGIEPFLQSKEDIPIVLTDNPSPYDESNVVLIERFKCDERIRNSFQPNEIVGIDKYERLRELHRQIHIRVGIDNLQNCLFAFFGIYSIGNTDSPFNTSQRASVEIIDYSVRERTIGQYHHSVIGSEYFRCRYIHFDYCLGVSAGSANIASYLAGQRGRNYRFYIDYSSRKEYLSMANIPKKGALLDLHYIYGTLSNSDGEDPLDFDALMRNPAELVVVATDAKTGEIRYFTKEDLQKDDYRVLMASSAIPVVTRFEEVGDTFFTDGGVGEPIPIERAFEDGCDKVVLVLTTPDAPMKQKRRDKVGSVLLQRSRPQVADLLRVRHEVYNHQRMLAHELEEQGKVLIISPDDVLGIKTLTKDKERLKSLYEKGYADAEKITAFMRGARA